MNRTVNVVRMQLVNRQTYIWIPLIVIGGALLVSLGSYLILHRAGISGVVIGGGAQAPLFYFLVVGAQALTLTFPFSQAMSVTRREFYLGTLLTAGLACAIMSSVFVLGGLLEQASAGWGMNSYFFDLPWVWEQGPAAAFLGYFVVAMLMFVIGLSGATIYKRAAATGLTVALLVAVLLLLGVVGLITSAEAWPQVGGWLSAQGAVGLSLWGAVLTAALAASCFPMFRRLTL